jgi:hypothetical protein
MKAGDRRAAYSLSSGSAANIKDNSPWIRLGFVMRLEIPCVVCNNDDILYVPNMRSVSSKREQSAVYSTMYQRGVESETAAVHSSAQSAAIAGSSYRETSPGHNVWRKLPNPWKHSFYELWCTRFGKQIGSRNGAIIAPPYIGTYVCKISKGERGGCVN